MSQGDVFLKLALSMAVFGAASGKIVLRNSTEFQIVPQIGKNMTAVCLETPKSEIDIRTIIWDH